LNRDTGIRNLIPGVIFDDEIKEDLRSQRAIRNRLEGMKTPEPFQSPDLRFAPTVDLKPTEIVHKEGEYGHPNYWKSEKELENYMVKDAIQMEKAKKFRQDPAWVAEHNERFPKFKTSVLPNKEKQQPKAVTVDDWRKDNPRWKKHVADHLAKDMQTINYNKDLGAWEDNFGEKRKGEEVLKEQQKISRMYKDMGVPEGESTPTGLGNKSMHQNTKTVKQLQGLKSWSQGGKVNAPHVKLHAAGTKLQAAPKGRDFYYDPSTQNMELVSNPPEHISSSELKAGTPAHKLKHPELYKAGYVDWWDRIETKNKT